MMQTYGGVQGLDGTILGRGWLVNMRLTHYILVLTTTIVIIGIYYVYMSDGAIMTAAWTKVMLLTGLNDPSGVSQLIVHTMGRLGNVMYQYAALYSITLKSGRSATMYTDINITSYFTNIQHNPNAHNLIGIQVFSYNESKELNFSSVPLLMEDSFYHVYPPYFALPAHDLLLCCYFQDYRYFINHTDDLRYLLTFNDDIKIRSREIFNNLTGQSSRPPYMRRTYIGVHVRRGDLVREKYQLEGYRLPEVSYFEKAARYYDRKYVNVRFIVASDNITWCKENLYFNEGPTFYSEAEEGEVDMALLGLCDHVIISVGTFSWMVGFLSHGDVIYYRDFARFNSTLAHMMPDNIEDHFLPSWIPYGD